jgi:hypothetical protein
MVGHDDEGPVFEVRSDTMTPENEPINTYKLDTKLKFGPRVKLYSISLTPTLYDPKDVFETPVNSVYVTPSYSNPPTFIPLKRLILTFSPEQAQDAAMGLLKMELKKMDDEAEKQEFVVSSGEEIDQTVKIAENQMQTVSKEDIAKLVKEEENKYMEELITMVRNAMTNKTKDYTFPGKRGILLRMTTDSVINDDTVIRSEDDIYLKS